MAVAVGGCLLPACTRECTEVGGLDSIQLTLPDGVGPIVQVCQGDDCYGPLDGPPGPRQAEVRRTGNTLALLLSPGSVLDRASTVTATTAEGRTLAGEAARPITSYPNGKGCDPTVRTLTATLV